MPCYSIVTIVVMGLSVNGMGKCGITLMSKHFDGITSWHNDIKKHRGGHDTPLGCYTDRSPMGLGQWVYCGQSTASEVFLIFTTQLYQWVIFLFALVIVKPEVFLPRYLRTAILHAAHFWRVVTS